LIVKVSSRGDLMIPRSRMTDALRITDHGALLFVVLHYLQQCSL